MKKSTKKLVSVLLASAMAAGMLAAIAVPATEMEARATAKAAPQFPAHRETT